MDEAPPGDDALIIDVGGFEGPLDLLLALARRAKVDLRAISILQLAEQYLLFVERAARARLGLAADYLVMAAWLAYLKSRLLLPAEPGEDDEAMDLAEDLAGRLARLQALREAGVALMARPRLGRDAFARGEAAVPAGPPTVRVTASLHDLLSAYASLRTRDEFRPFALDREGVLAMEEALARLRPLIGEARGWSDLSAWLPPEWSAPGPRRRAGVAATFAAMLELAREGLAEIRQDGAFGPIQIRRAAP